MTVPTVGEKVAALRASRRWTLKELSERSGISVSHLSAVESGSRANPSISMVIQLARAFGISIAFFDDSDTQGNIRHDKIVQTKTDIWDDLVLSKKLRDLYDETTRDFIVAENSQPYVAFARDLAQDKTWLHNPSQLLQQIARFLSTHESE